MLRTVHYAGSSLIRNGWAIAVEDRDVAFDLVTADAVDTERVGIGILTGAPECGVQGIGPKNPVSITVFMARLATKETDEDIADLLRVVHVRKLTDRINRDLREAYRRGARPDELVIVMDPKAFMVVKAHGLECPTAREFDVHDFDDIRIVTLHGVQAVEGQTERGRLFHVTRRVE